MSFKINVFARSPSPHMLDLWEAVNRLKEVELYLFIQEPIAITKRWGKIDKSLQVEILHWSSKNFFQQLSTLYNISKHKVNVWIIAGSNYWTWEVQFLLILLHNYKQKVCYIAEPICWKKNWLSNTSLVQNIIKRHIKKKITPLILRRFDGIAAMGTWGLQEYRHLLPKTLVFETQYYVNLNQLHSIERSRKKKSDKIIFGYCGQFIPRKGLHILFKQLDKIVSYDNWLLFIAGEGPQRKMLEEILPNEVQSRVKFLGFLNRSQLRDFLKNIDCLIFPSLFDGWGMVILESLCAGVPVLSGFNVGAARHYINDGQNGWIRKVDDDFLNPICGLLDNPEQINLMSNAARKSVENYRPEIGALELVKNLQLLVS